MQQNARPRGYTARSRSHTMAREREGELTGAHPMVLSSKRVGCAKMVWTPVPSWSVSASGLSTQPWLRQRRGDTNIVHLPNTGTCPAQSLSKAECKIRKGVLEQQVTSICPAILSMGLDSSRRPQEEPRGYPPPLGFLLPHFRPTRSAAERLQPLGCEKTGL